MAKKKLERPIPERITPRRRGIWGNKIVAAHICSWGTALSRGLCHAITSKHKCKLSCNKWSQASCSWLVTAWVRGWKLLLNVRYRSWNFLTPSNLLLWPTSIRLLRTYVHFWKNHRTSQGYFWIGKMSVGLNELYFSIFWMNDEKRLSIDELQYFGRCRSGPRKWLVTQLPSNTVSDTRPTLSQLRSVRIQRHFRTT